MIKMLYSFFQYNHNKTKIAQLVNNKLYKKTDKLACFTMIIKNSNKKYEASVIFLIAPKLAQMYSLKTHASFLAN